MTSSKLVAGSCLLACLSTAVAAQGRGGAGAEPPAHTLDYPAAALLHAAADGAYPHELERAVNLQIRGVVGGLVGGVPSVQTPAGGDPMVGPVVRNAPYSGDAATTVTQVLMDGTRIEQGTTARFYRDSAGRVRREQTIIGLDQLNPSGDVQTVVTIAPTPGDAFAYQLDPIARTARRVGRTSAGLAVIRFSGNAIVGRRGGGPAESSRPVEESLGTRQFEGVKAIGRKTTTTIPTGQIGNDRPIEITDERWESPELQVLLYSRHSDPRTGIVEYRLTNISRAEPPPDLFVVPPDYTINEGLRVVPGAGGRGEPGPGTRGRQ